MLLVFMALAAVAVLASGLTLRWVWELDGESDRNRRLAARLQDAVARLDSRIDAWAAAIRDQDAQVDALARSLDAAHERIVDQGVRVAPLENDRRLQRDDLDRLANRIKTDRDDDLVQWGRLADRVASLTERVATLMDTADNLRDGLAGRVAVAETQRHDIQTLARHIEHLFRTLRDAVIEPEAGP